MRCQEISSFMFSMTLRCAKTSLMCARSKNLTPPRYSYAISRLVNSNSSACEWCEARKRTAISENGMPSARNSKIRWTINSASSSEVEREANHGKSCDFLTLFKFLGYWRELLEKRQKI